MSRVGWFSVLVILMQYGLLAQRAEAQGLPAWLRVTPTLAVRSGLLAQTEATAPESPARASRAVRQIAIGSGLMLAGVGIAIALGRKSVCYDQQRPVLAPVIGGSAVAAAGLTLALVGGLRRRQLPLAERRVPQRQRRRVAGAVLGTAAAAGALLLVPSLAEFFICNQS